MVTHTEWVTETSLCPAVEMKLGICGVLLIFLDLSLFIFMLHDFQMGVIICLYLCWKFQ